MRSAWTEAACALAWALPVWAAPAAAQDTPPKWEARADDAFASLSFQVPESDDVRFYVQCDHNKRVTSLTVFAEIKSAKKGQPVTIDIVNGAEKIAIKGRTATDELNGYIYAEAERFAIAPLLALLERGGEVTARAKTATMKLPDAGRAAAVREFRPRCKIN